MKYKKSTRLWKCKQCYSPHWKIYHWMSRTKIFNVYSAMRQRCINTKDKRYKDYWGRWIHCLWNSFEEFYNDMQSTYKEWLSIDRIDNDGNYCKENCRWSTKIEQRANTRVGINRKKFILNLWWEISTWDNTKKCDRELWLREWTIYQLLRTNAKTRKKYFYFDVHYINDK